MRPHVPQSVSGERARQLTSLAVGQRKCFLENALGKQFKAIIEKRRITEIRAVSENFIHIRINEDKKQDLRNLGGKEVTVQISKILPVRSQTESVEAEALLVLNNL
jgi:threonylcarbamoyladenosine tRNA methylthiotransferase MtaB